LGENSSRKHYPKLIVEVFREIAAECTARLTARLPFSETEFRINGCDSLKAPRPGRVE
jgi:hypothetical protein